MRKTLLLLTALLIAAVASAGGPQIVFENSETNSKTFQISSIGRINFLSEALEVTDNLGDILYTVPYSEIIRIKVDFEGSSSVAVPVAPEVSMLKVFPSPAADVVTVSGLDVGSDFRLYRSDGSLVGNVKGYSGEAIDVSSLAPGVYIIAAEAGSVKFFKK